MPLIIWAITIGVYPKPYFDVLERPVAQIVHRVHQSANSPLAGLPARATAAEASAR